MKKWFYDHNNADKRNGIHNKMMTGYGNNNENSNNID